MARLAPRGIRITNNTETEVIESTPALLHADCLGQFLGSAVPGWIVPSAYLALHVFFGCFLAIHTSAMYALRPTSQASPTLLRPGTGTLLLVPGTLDSTGGTFGQVLGRPCSYLAHWILPHWMLRYVP